MNVRELITELSRFPGDANVYVPSRKGVTDIVKTVCTLMHLELPVGVAIPDDVVVLPWGPDELDK